MSTVQSSMGKVILRARDGAIQGAGFSRQEYISEQEIKVVSRKGNEEVYPLESLKAVFFVKDFEGDPSYDEVKFLRNLPRSKWVWVRVHFPDGEVLEGKAENSKSLLFSTGFFLWPSDESTNNEIVYVVKEAIEDFEILAI